MKQKSKEVKKNILHIGLNFLKILGVSCALPQVNPWGLYEINNQKGMSLLHTLPYGVYS